MIGPLLLTNLVHVSALSCMVVKRLQNLICSRE